MHLLLVAILPAIILMFVIYKVDKVEKEPIGFVLGIAGLGILSCIPTVICELVAEMLLVQVVDSTSIIYIFLDAFLGVALIEEFWKLFVVRVFVWNAKAFNYRFDAIVYCVASSLGFALLENILYVFQSGFATGIARAILSVPGHCTFGVFMGYFLGNAKLFEVKGQKKKSWQWVFFALLFPTLQHGFFDFVLMVDTEQEWIELLMLLLFLGFVFVCDVVAIVRIARSGKQDLPFYVLKKGDRWISNPEWLQMAALTMDEQMPNVHFDMKERKN